MPFAIASDIIGKNAVVEERFYLHGNIWPFLGKWESDVLLDLIIQEQSVLAHKNAENQTTLMNFKMREGMVY